MSVWKADAPEVAHLDNYNILEVGDESFFIGNDMNAYGARRSTAIQSFDPETLEGKTASGQKYKLHGKPGLDDDARYLLAATVAYLKQPYTLRWN